MYQLSSAKYVVGGGARPEGGREKVVHYACHGQGQQTRDVVSLEAKDEARWIHGRPSSQSNHCGRSVVTCSACRLKVFLLLRAFGSGPPVMSMKIAIPSELGKTILITMPHGRITILKEGAILIGSAGVLTPSESSATNDRTTRSLNRGKPTSCRRKAATSAHLSLGVLAMRNVPLARERAEPPPAVGARDEARVRRRRLRRR